jgi:hypothetical protein
MAEQAALQVWVELLAVNQDLRTGLQSISACLEEAEGRQKGMLLETGGVVAVGLLEQKVWAALLELALRLV